MHYALTVAILTGVWGSSASTIRTTRHVMATLDECVAMHDAQLDAALELPKTTAMFVTNCDETPEAIDWPERTKPAGSP